jgi:ABC-type branched-subunit amino acid transport system ATPase component
MRQRVVVNDARESIEAVISGTSRKLLSRLILAATVFLLLRLTVLLMLHAAIDYEPDANPALLGFLFVNAVVFDTASFRLLLDALHRITAERIAHSGTDDASEADRVFQAMRRTARSVAGAMVLLLIGSYLFLLSPVAAVLVVVVGLVIGGAGIAFGMGGRRSAEMDPAYGGAGPWSRDRTAGHAAARLLSARTDDNRLAVQSAVGLLGVGFVSICAPVLAGHDPATVVRVALAALLLWTTTLFLTGSGSLDGTPQSGPVAVRVATEPVPWEPTTVTLPAQGALAETRVHVAPGLVLLVAGDNGSGKSALFRRLAGQGPAWDGVTETGEEPPSSGPQAAERLRGITTLVTETPTLPDFTVEPDDCAALAAILPIAGLPAEMLDKDGLLHSRAASRMLQMRVGLALGMMARSPVLLLDGFLNGQDAPFRRHFVEATLPHLRSLGYCTVLSAIEPDILPEVDGRFILRDGHLVAV